MIDKQLIELQSQFAFQEDLLRELNDIVVRQQAQIEALQRESQLQADKLTDLSARMSDGVTVGAEEDKPPHY